MAEYQRFNGEFVDLTSEGIEKIKSYPNNDFSEESRPINSGERDWNTYSFFSFWVGIVISISVYMLASGLLSSGMNWWQALFTIGLGHAIVMIPAVMLGHFGTKYGTNFPLLSKFAFGYRGNIIPTLARGILGCFWFGIQSWIGGTAVNSILSTLIPAYSSIAISSFISFILFLILNVIIGLKGSGFIKFIEKYLAVVLIVLCFLVIVWASQLAGGFINVFKDSISQGDGGSFWSAFWPSLTSIIAFDSTIALNMCDYTRHSKSQKAQTLGQLIGAPITTVFIALVGIFGSVGSKLAFGEVIWDPATLVSKFENPVVVVVFSLVIVGAVLTTNVAGNLIPPGIVLSSLWPKIFKYRVAIIIVGVIGIITRPWNILESPDSYYAFINTIATILGPMTGIYMVTYGRKLKSEINLVDLYRRDGGAYYYTNGWNVKGCVILIATTVFVAIGKFWPPMSVVYDSAYIIGAVLAAVLFIIADRIPARHN